MDTESYDLDKALDALGWRRATLAARLGIWRETVTRWNGGKVPQYAIAYLDAMIQLKKVRDFLDKRLAA